MLYSPKKTHNQKFQSKWEKSTGCILKKRFLVFKCKPSLGISWQHANNLQKFKHRQFDSVLFTKARIKKSNTDWHYTLHYCAGIPAQPAKHNTFLTNVQGSSTISLTVLFLVMNFSPIIFWQTLFSIPERGHVMTCQKNKHPH